VVEAYMASRVERDGNGELKAPDAPGLGVGIDPAGLRRYLQDVEIKVGGKVLYRTPTI
jgi:L-alanine-DL-glutamate epimerase-like enolase superfamily enzyme